MALERRVLDGYIWKKERMFLAGGGQDEQELASKS